MKKEIEIPIDHVHLKGILQIPSAPIGIVLFVHGSGSSRLSTRNQYVAGLLNKANIATLLFDLLTSQEEVVDELTREHRFNIPLLTSRLSLVTHWVKAQSMMSHLPVAYFGASTGAAAALQAAADNPDIVRAVVSRGGRPDLAGEALLSVQAPTLLIVGGNDDVVIGMNQQAMSKMSCIKTLKIVPGATHLFEEPGTLDQAANLAKEWFVQYLK
jgi:putative phosphoribosyl transferase